MTWLESACADRKRRHSGGSERLIPQLGAKRGCWWPWLSFGRPEPCREIRVAESLSCTSQWWSEQRASLTCRSTPPVRPPASSVQRRQSSPFTISGSRTTKQRALLRFVRRLPDSGYDCSREPRTGEIWTVGWTVSWVLTVGQHLPRLRLSCFWVLFESCFATICIWKWFIMYLRMCILTGNAKASSVRIHACMKSCMWIVCCATGRWKPSAAPKDMP